MRTKPRNKKQSSLIDPARVFIAVMIVAVVFFLPMVAPGDEKRDSFSETYPALNPLASSADACPFKCIRCIEYDPDAWPNDCLTWECDESGECGDDGVAGAADRNRPPSSQVSTARTPD